jgi:hypothetical protein
MKQPFEVAPLMIHGFQTRKSSLKELWLAGPGTPSLPVPTLERGELIVKRRRTANPLAA